MIRCSSDPSRPRELSWPELVFPVKSHLPSLTLCGYPGRRDQKGANQFLHSLPCFLNLSIVPLCGVWNNTFVQVAQKQRHVVCDVIYANSWSRIILVDNEINPNRTSEMMAALCSIKYKNPVMQAGCRSY